jgi:hypothetical protein
MPDHDELEQLRRRIAELEAKAAEADEVKHRFGEHEAMRSGAVDALRLVQGQVERLQHRIDMKVPDEVEQARARGWQEQDAIIKTRLHAAEEWLRELSTIAIEDHEMLRELLALMKRSDG